MGFKLALMQNGIMPTMALTLGQLPKKLSIAPKEELENLAKVISDLTKIPIEPIFRDVKIVLGGASQVLIEKALNESRTNKRSAENVRDLLARRAGEIQRAQAAGIGGVSEGRNASEQMGRGDIQDRRGEVGVQGIQRPSHVVRGDGEVNEGKSFSFRQERDPIPQKTERASCTFAGRPPCLVYTKYLANRFFPASAVSKSQTREYL